MPPGFASYFTASAAAAGALIGLLFVAVSLDEDSVFGPEAPAQGRVLAASAFVGLADAFLISLMLLIPGTKPGVVALVLGFVSLLLTLRLQHRLGRGNHTISLVVSALAYGAEVAEGIALLATAGDRRGLLELVCWSVVASLSVALVRAWLLLEGWHRRGAPADR